MLKCAGGVTSASHGGQNSKRHLLNRAKVINRIYNIIYNNSILLAASMDHVYHVMSIDSHLEIQYIV